MKCFGERERVSTTESMSNIGAPTLPKNHRLCIFNTRRLVHALTKACLLIHGDFVVHLADARLQPHQVCRKTAGFG